MTAAPPSRRSLSLRSRLLLGTLLIALLAIGIFGLATVTLLRSYLLDRVDSQLLALRAPVTGPRAPFEGNLLDPRGASPTGTIPPTGSAPNPAPNPGQNPGQGQGPGPGLGRLSALSIGFALLDENGQVLTSVPSGINTNPDPAPKLPHLTYDEVAGSVAFEQPFTVEAEGNPSFHYRVLVTAFSSSRHIAVTAIPINSDDATIGRLLFVEGLVAVVVLFAVAVVGWRVVGVGLRPLDDMTDTATAIAGGAIGERVDATDRDDEVGRLAEALNSMLAQLELALREREVSEEQLRQFVADASHELRTPLTSIRGYAELYRNGMLPTSEAVDDAIRRIEDESGRMSVLVDDLLLLARLDQGRPLERTSVDLVAVATDAVHDLQAVAPERVVTVTHDPDVVVLGDPSRLHQVIANLLENARVHTPVTAAISVAVHADGDDAVVRIADDGPGMDASTAARVFERSFRGDGATRNHAGSGLGLSIVAAIAEAHGGSASVASAPGTGTAFTVRIPRNSQGTPRLSPPGSQGDVRG